MADELHSNAILNFDDFSSRLDGLLELIRKLVEEDKLFRASKLHSFVLSSMQHYGHIEDDAKLRVLQERIDSFLGNEFGENLAKQSREMGIVLETLASDEGWTLVKESSGVKTFYRHEAANPLHSIKLQGILDAPLLNVLAVLFEIDLYSKWWPLSKEIRELKRLSRYRKIVHMIVELPWPLWNRDTLLYAYGIDNLEDNHLMVCFRSCTPEEEARLVGPVHADRCVRSEWNVGGMLMTPISPTQTQVSILANADPKFNFLPHQIMNTFTKFLSPLMFERLRQQSNAIEGTEYEDRIRKHPEIYQEIKERLAVYFDQSLPSALEKQLESPIDRASIGKQPYFVDHEENLLD